MLKVKLLTELTEPEMEHHTAHVDWQFIDDDGFDEEREEEEEVRKLKGATVIVMNYLSIGRMNPAAWEQQLLKPSRLKLAIS